MSCFILLREKIGVFGFTLSVASNIAKYEDTSLRAQALLRVVTTPCYQTCQSAIAAHNKDCSFVLRMVIGELPCNARTEHGVLPSGFCLQATATNV